MLLGSRKKKARKNPKATRCRLGAYPLKRRIFIVNIPKEFRGFKRPLMPSAKWMACECALSRNGEYEEKLHEPAFIDKEHAQSKSKYSN